MEKTLNFAFEGKDYTLSFTRNSVIATENMGFSVAEVASKPVKSMTLLWRGAFLAHHSTLTIAEVDEIFEKIDKEGLLDALLELYRAPVESLFEVDEKNVVKWTVK